MATEAEIRKRDIEILKKLKRGYTCSTVIQWVQDTYNLSESHSQKIVYQLNKDLKKSLSELTDEAASYIAATLIGEIEDCNEDNDRKNKLKAIELLAKTLKVTESIDKQNINIKFDFGQDDK